jgi:hypothetical protein
MSWRRAASASKYPHGELAVVKSSEDSFHSITYPGHILPPSHVSEHEDEHHFSKLATPGHVSNSDGEGARRSGTVLVKAKGREQTHLKCEQKRRAPTPPNQRWRTGEVANMPAVCPSKSEVTEVPSPAQD